MNTWRMFAAAALLGGCGHHSMATPPDAQAAGFVERFDVVSSVDAFGGATPAGAAGPYTLITGIVHGKLLPGAADNAAIVDLRHARVGPDGYVAYTTDVVILRPKSAATARRVLFYDVVNRGNKVAPSLLIGGGALTAGAAPDATFPSMLRAGYTVVWSGWQGDVVQTGAGAVHAIGTSFPTAKNADGTSITGLSREEFVADVAGRATISLAYAPASLSDRAEVVFTARQSWLGGDGKQGYTAAAAPVTTWRYVADANGAYSVQFVAPATLPARDGSPVPPDGGTIYSFVYRAKDPTVMGIGFAAVRDLVAFLKNERVDAAGNANPVADLRAAACAAGTGCAADPTTNFDVALGEGLSQSGRFLRDFLYRGFNRDVAGRRVFDGMLALIPASRRTWVNARFAQPGRWSRQHEDHWMPGDQFPFAYGVATDPLTGVSDGLMKHCLATSTCPKIMQLDGGNEWWAGRAALVVTDGAGHDIALPSNVRYYLVAGTQHGGGAGVSTGITTQPAAGNLCQFAASPVTLSAVARALIPALDAWVVRDVAPPASQYPTVAAGTLVAPDRRSTGFPDLSSVSVPNDAAATPTALRVDYQGLTNQLFVTDYGAAVPVPDLAKQYTALAPKVDSNGNDVAGILMPELAVPLATYMGWNLRGAGHAAGELCASTGSAIPFATNARTRSATDPRATLADLYRGRADYQARFAAAADALVARGFLTPTDATFIYKAGAAAVSPTLIPAP